MAVECANEQGKFLPYADKMYSSQAVWSKLKDANGMLRTYAAQLGLNSANFNKCLADKKYQEKLMQSSNEGQSFGLNETPSIFIGSDIQTSLASYDDIKRLIDEQLAE